MKVLIADDDEVSCLVLESLLARRGYEVVTATDGDEAWRALQEDDSPKLAVLDWMMPGLDGVEICRRARATPRLTGVYLILLTSRDRSRHVVTGLQSGANDYVTKPFANDELEARINVGAQVVRLQAELAQRIRDLETAFAQVKQLRGLLPICAYCKKIRDGENYWQQVEAYIAAHSDARCSHGICPACWESVVKPELCRNGIPAPDVGLVDPPPRSSLCCILAKQGEVKKELGCKVTHGSHGFRPSASGRREATEGSTRGFILPPIKG